MPKKVNAYYRPTHLTEALHLLQKPDVVPLAGGTSLLASEDGLPVAGVVDLQDLGLDQIALGDGRLHLGAMVRLADLDDYLTAETPDHPLTHLLHRAIRHAGANTYRNAATLGGVIAARLPDSELLAALLVLEAEIEIRRLETTEVPFRGDWETERLEQRSRGAGEQGELEIRDWRLGDYLVVGENPQSAIPNPQSTRHGLITAVIIPWTDGIGGSERVARTPADYPIVSMTGWRPSGEAIRLAATGIAARPIRLPEAEQAVANTLVGGLNKEMIHSAATAARAASHHPGDFRGAAAYRAEMAAVLTRRLLASLEQSK